MIRYFKISFLIIFVFSINNTFSQTFSATTGANAALKESGATITFPIATTNQWDAYRWVKVYVNVSGLGNLTAGTLELVQVNLDYGDASQSFYTSTTTDIFIKSPNGAEYKILDGGSVNYKDVNTKLRDNSQLNRPCLKSAPKPYSVGYYRTYTAGMFDNFLGEDPNGDWEIRFDNNSTRTRPKITNVELVFGHLTEVDILSSTDNDACATPQEFCEEAEIVYQNVGHTGDGSADPPPSGSNPCNWNNNLDNTSWFSFKATQSTAVITISGMSGVDHQQFIVVGNSSGGNSCNQSDLYTVTGGCPTDVVNNYNSLYSNGTYYNMNFNLSGLTVGDTYYLVSDGDGGAQSPAYLTVSGCSECGNVLPIELSYFSGKSTNSGNKLSWQTASEINNDYFTIERSLDARNWGEIGMIYGAGNSNTIENYQFIDDNLKNTIYYYRLKQTDYDGSYTYSKIISINTNQKQSEINFSPNPVKDYLIVELGKYVNQYKTIRIIDIIGETVKLIEATNSSTRINLSELPKGIYYLKIGESAEKLIKL